VNRYQERFPKSWQALVEWRAINGFTEEIVDERVHPRELKSFFDQWKVDHSDGWVMAFQDVEEKLLNKLHGL